ncbi:MAG: hypothetical protein IPO82_05860 [Betaproteobacteria bacterium]|nr:hypothetical protein [Betaproteobacteria bacterium]
MTWGFAYSLPFAQVVAICLLVSLAINYKKLYAPPSGPQFFAMIAFVVWLGVSPLFSFHPEHEVDLWLRAFKVQLMVLIAMLIVGAREQLHQLVWVLALSIGFFGIKGGLFTIVGGGQGRVWGPSGSFISDNNQLALAMLMAVPLFRYLQLQSKGLGCASGASQ